MNDPHLSLFSILGICLLLEHIATDLPHYEAYQTD